MKKYLACTLALCLMLTLVNSGMTFAASPENQDGFLTYFSFDGDLTNTGSVGLDGEAVGNPAFVAGRSGEAGDSAIQFSGSNYVKVPAEVFVPGQSFSVSFWMMEPQTDESFNTAQRIVSTGVWGDGGQGILLGVYNYDSPEESWSKIISGVGSAAPAFEWTEAGALYNDGVWRHVVGVFDEVNKSASIYLNGALANTYEYPANGGTLCAYEETAIGGMLDGAGSFAEGFSGVIDDLSVVPFALSAEDVLSLKNGELFADNKDPVTVKDGYISYFDFNENTVNTGSSRKDGEAVGTPTFVPGHSGAAGDQAVQFSGTNYIKVAGEVFSPGTSFSVGFWMMEPETDESYDAVQRIVSTGVWGDGGKGITLGVYNLSNRAESWSKIISGVGCATPSLMWSEAEALYNDGVWRHITGVFDEVNKKAAVYLDGVLVNSYQYPDGGGALSEYAFTAIGGMLDSTGAFLEGFSGVIDELAVIPSVLTEREVMRLKNGIIFTDLPDPEPEPSEDPDPEPDPDEDPIISEEDNVSTGDASGIHPILMFGSAVSLFGWGCLKLKKRRKI